MSLPGGGGSSGSGDETDAQYTADNGGPYTGDLSSNTYSLWIDPDDDSDTDTDYPPLDSSDPDYLLDLDDDSEDDATSLSDTKISIKLRIHLRHIRLKMRTADPGNWTHIRNLIHLHQSSEATQELLYWYAHHPELH